MLRLQQADWALEIAPTGSTGLLGAAGAGKTALLRQLAGLDQPHGGRLLADSADLTGLPAGRRDVAFVPTEIVNYPHLSVRDNIASPLDARLQRQRRQQPRGRAPADVEAAAAAARADRDAAVLAIAVRLRIDAFLDGLPSRLSRADQRRVALARAFVRQASLTLLDDPLAGIEARERVLLRDDLTDLIDAASGAVVLATREPDDALMLGGRVAVVVDGRVLQQGDGVEVSLRPGSLAVAGLFGDPVLNLLGAHAERNTLQIDGGPRIALLAALKTATPDVTVGVRAGDLRWRGQGGDVHIDARIDAVDAFGSDRLVMASSRCGPLVARLARVAREAQPQRLDIGQTVRLHLDPGAICVFSRDGALLLAPERAGRRAAAAARVARRAAAAAAAASTRMAVAPSAAAAVAAAAAGPAMPPAALPTASSAGPPKMTSAMPSTPADVTPPAAAPLALPAVAERVPATSSDAAPGPRSN